jgi:hypothetical protein
VSDVSSFWARRRAAVKAEAEAELRATKEAESDAIAAARAERSDTEVLAELGLPDPVQMKSGDDFSGFLARDVPEHLRRQALRTLWRSNPVLACVDGLNDYDDDYRAAMLLRAPIKTAYQVGKGMMKHVEEMERQAAARENQAAAREKLSDDGQPTDAPEVIEEVPTSVAAVGEDQVLQEAEVPAVAQTQAKQPEQEDAAPLPRRMRFRFEEAAL